LKIRIVTVALALFVGLVAVIQAQPENLLGALAVSDTTVRDTSKDTIASPDTIQYDSDSLEYGADDRSLLLLGNAHLKYRTTILAADSIHFDQATQILEASGSPDVQDPTFQPFKGRALKYNLKTRFGAVYQARSFKNGEYFRGAEIRRFPDKTVQILDGDYCKCNGVDVPDYYFATERMEIEPDKVATAAPVVLNIEEVPVLIAPFVLFPLGKGRRSGFLTPKLGGDQKQGFFVRNLGMYWGISTTWT
jgi:lipopolysaccharide assembly outer membrane protein LptD (OstA)